MSANVAWSDLANALQRLIAPQFLPAVLLILLAATLEGVAQVCLKCSVNAGGAYRRIWLPMGVALFAVEIGVYTRALRSLDVTVAYPLSALSYVAVALAARALLRERPSRQHWVGLGCIVAGAALSLPEG